MFWMNLRLVAARTALSIWRAVRRNPRKAAAALAALLALGGYQLSPELRAALDLLLGLAVELAG